MKTVEMARATAPLAEYARQARSGALVVTLHGKPVATVIAVPKGADWESLAIGSHPKFLAMMQRSRIAHRKLGGLSSVEMRRRLGIKRGRKTAKNP
jgi:antitoxin (DNA-binding transcriptional repressor) of toxin-antitoxin stability system